eukprot:13556922-Alexandrium_andersonii.AAC.1
MSMAEEDGTHNECAKAHACADNAIAHMFQTTSSHPPPNPPFLTQLPGMASASPEASPLPLTCVGKQLTPTTITADEHWSALMIIARKLLGASIAAASWLLARTLSAIGATSASKGAMTRAGASLCVLGACSIWRLHSDTLPADR